MVSNSLKLVLLLAFISVPSHANWEGVKRSCSIFFESQGWKRLGEYRLPTAISTEPLLASDVWLLRAFQVWRPISGKIWSGYRHTPGSTDGQNANISIDLSSKEIGFWVENPSYFEPIISNIRRIAWAILETDMTLREAPEAGVSGINGVSIRRMPITGKTFRFGDYLLRTLGDKTFDNPLRGLSQAEWLLLEAWFIRFDQRESALQRPIRFSEIAETPLK